MAKAVQMPSRRERGFEPAGGLLQSRIRTVGEKRGFAVSRLLTQWAEIVGGDFSNITRPVKISYGREGIGATLTLLVSGPHAPQVQMSLEQIRDRVNSAYGFNAISRLILTQSAATGFADGKAEFVARPKPVPEKDRIAEEKASAMAAPIGDPMLRAALMAMGEHIFTSRDNKKGS